MLYRYKYSGLNIIVRFIEDIPNSVYCRCKIIQSNGEIKGWRNGLTTVFLRKYLFPIHDPNKLLKELL